MESNSQPSRSQRALRYAACYLLLFLLLVLGYVVFAMIWRSTLMALIVAFSDETDVDARFRGGAIYLFSMVLLMLGFFIGILAGEPYLRAGAERGVLLRRFARLALPLAAIGVLGILLQALARLVG